MGGLGMGALHITGDYCVLVRWDHRPDEVSNCPPEAVVKKWRDCCPLSGMGSCYFQPCPPFRPVACPKPWLSPYNSFLGILEDHTSFLGPLTYCLRVSQSVGLPSAQQRFQDSSSQPSAVSYSFSSSEELGRHEQYSLGSKNKLPLCTES